MKVYILRNDQGEEIERFTLEYKPKGFKLVGVVHELKILPHFFADVASGYKTFEIRKNDRGFKVNDVILLKEWEPKVESFTDRQVIGDITYITDYEQKDDFVVMAFKLRCKHTHLRGEQSGN